MFKINLLKPTETIQDIHDEFDNSVDKILEQANDILNKEELQDKEEIKELEKLGFTNLDSVILYNKINKEKQEAEESLKIVNNYKEKYPDNKFINKIEIQRICKKYGLIFGKSSNYIGDIPIKNRKEIVSFKLKEEDFVYYILGDFGSVYSESYEKYKKQEDKSSLTYAYNVVHKNQEMVIVATPDLFNLKNKEIENFEIKIIEKDPIVLHPVNGGYLIISKWGSEENIDELQQN